MSSLKRTITIEKGIPMKRSRMMKKKSRSSSSTLLNEMKYFDVVVAALTAVAAGGSVASLNSIAEGSDYNNRVGRRLVPKYVQLNYYMSATTNLDVVKISLVWDSQPNASLATYNTIFNVATSSPALALRNVDNSVSRFKILWDEEILVAGGVTDNDNVTGQKFINLSRMQAVEYSGAAAAVPYTGALYLCLGSYTNSGAAGSATCAYTARFAFND